MTELKKLKSKAQTPPTERFQWLDSVKGIAVIWIALYHCLLSYDSQSLPWPITVAGFPDFVKQGGTVTAFGYIPSAIEGIITGIIQRGPQAVGVFILFSGFGLTYSLAKSGKVKIPWIPWYRRRIIRLFPVYWIAHLLFLVSPFAVLHNQIDYRFILSFLGDRIFPVDRMFFYLVPAWWFMGLLFQLYVVFPLLFKAMNAMGSLKYLVFCILLSSAARYVLFGIVQADGDYVMGAFFLCRLWEFAAGMTLGKLIGEKPEDTLGILLSLRGLLAGAIVYALGLFTYQPNFLFSFSDGLTAMGLSAILIHLAYRLDKTPGLGKVLAGIGVYSYGIYLFHQPYVMYAGEKLRSNGLGVFLVGAFAVTALISLFSIFLEFAVNRAINLLRR